MNSKLTYENGFAHLLLFLFVVVVAVVAILFWKNTSFRESLESLYTDDVPAPVVTPTPVGLEEQLNELEDTDPSSDFKEVDSDINNL